MDSAPVSLYLDLERGSVADMEVVAQAALAFARAIKEVAFIIDPSLEIHVGLESGTEGSLSLNSWIKNLKNSKGEKVTLRAIALVVLSWFALQTAEWTYQQVEEHLFGDKSHAEHFSPEQKKELTDIFLKATAEKAAAPQVQRVYRALEQDGAIKGVGASQTKGVKPAVIVPRDQFAVRGGHSLSEEHGITRRVRTERTSITLISPVLLEGTKRRWKFHSSAGEFGASVMDGDFLDSIVAGRLGMPMAGGIELDVDLETTEEFRSTVWVPIERRVLHVYDKFKLPTQATLPLVPSEPSQSSAAPQEQGRAQTEGGDVAPSEDGFKQGEGGDAQPQQGRPKPQT
jgi:hypothetical protein